MYYIHLSHSAQDDHRQSIVCYDVMHSVNDDVSIVIPNVTICIG